VAGKKEEVTVEEKVMVFIPRDKDGDDAISVIVNGDVTRLQRGKRIMVSKAVADNLENSDRQDAIAFELMENLQKANPKIADL